MEEINHDLKELLKPPFAVCKDGIVIDRNCWVLFRIGCPPILEDAKFSGWISAAMNEKAEREFGEPLRWIEHPIPGHCSRYECPKCGKYIGHYVNSKTISRYKHCEYCGQRLLPPEGESTDNEKAI